MPGRLMHRIALGLYNLAYPVGVALTFPYVIYKLGTVPKYRAGLSQKLGFELPEPLPHSRRVWFHGVSVGETLAIAPLVEEFKRRHPQVGVYYSVTTHTGMEIALKRLSGVADAVFYFPFDFYPVVWKVVSRTAPSAVVIAETEIWPSFVEVCRSRNVPLFMVNARVSPSSFNGYMRIRWFMRPVLEAYRYIFARSPLDAARLVQLGAPQDRVKVTGNIKFYSVLLRSKSVSPDRVREDLGLGSFPLWVCGSTHRGEEEILLEAYRMVLEQVPELRLAVVPRHPERFREVEELIRAKGFNLGLRSRRDALADHQVLLVDTMGELFSLYSVAQVVFVGGSLVEVGGHNPLEPLVFGVPTAIGPHHFNFADVMEEVGEFVEVVEDAGQLASFVLEVLKGQCPFSRERVLERFSEAGRAVDEVLRALEEVL